MQHAASIIFFHTEQGCIMVMSTLVSNNGNGDNRCGGLLRSFQKFFRFIPSILPATREILQKHILINSTMKAFST